MITNNLVSVPKYKVGDIVYYAESKGIVIGKIEYIRAVKNEFGAVNVHYHLCGWSSEFKEAELNYTV